MESSNDEERDSICLMENYQDDEVISYFYYHGLFCICKKLKKLEQIVSASKDIIYFLESKYKNLEKEIKILREIQNYPVKNSSTSNKEDEPDKCKKCAP